MADSNLSRPRRGRLDPRGSSPTSASIAAQGPQLGDRYLFAYATELFPEWVVLAADASTVTVVPMTEFPLVGFDDVALVTSPAAPASICHLDVKVELRLGCLRDAHLLEPIPRDARRKLRVAVEGRAVDSLCAVTPAEVEQTYDYIEHMSEVRADALRLVAAVDGARLPGRASVERSTEARRRRRLVGAAKAATLVLAVIAGIAGLRRLVPPEVYVRRDPGLYALRSGGAGELGFELDVDGQRCLATGVTGSAPCPVRPGATIRALYRLDGRLGSWSAQVTKGDPSSSQMSPLIAPRRLSPTAIDGRERCSEGLCEFAQWTMEPASLPVTLVVSATADPYLGRRRSLHSAFRLVHAP